MVFSKWRKWAHLLLWIHIGALLANGIVYGIITFNMDVPFNTIFQYPETAPYYLITYACVLIFSLTLCSVGLIFGDVFGHRDLRSQLVSRGLLVVGVLGCLLPVTLITMWDLSLNDTEHVWSNLVLAAQHFGIWLTLVLLTTYATILLMLFFLSKELASIPKGWSTLCLALAIIGYLMAFSCFWISELVLVFRIIYLIGAGGYLLWAMWLAMLLRKIEQIR